MREEAKGMVMRTVGNLLVALFWANLFVLNVAAFAYTPKLSLLVLSVLEGITVILYVVRILAQVVSRHFFDWALGVVGTCVVMLYRPTLSPDFTPGEVLTIFGALFAILSLLSLNRSFGIVAARRHIKTRGMYQLVRHPAYASYCILCLGYVLTNPSLYNCVVFVITVLFLVVRVEREEALLTKSEEYTKYKERVIWKVAPFLY